MANKDSVVWQGPPDPERGIYFPVYSPKVGQEIVAVVLSEKVTGVMTYYEKPTEEKGRGQTRPCLGSKEKCQGCALGLEHRWKGYLACWDHKKGRLFLAEVTREAYLRCGAFELWQGQLRGKTVRLTRNGEAKNARVTAHLSLWTGEVRNLPPCFNVQSALERIWFGAGTSGKTTPPAAPPCAPPPEELFPPEGPYGV